MKLYFNPLTSINIPLYRLITFFIITNSKKIKSKKSYITLFKYYFNYPKRLIVLFQNHKEQNIINEFSQ